MVSDCYMMILYDGILYGYDIITIKLLLYDGLFHQFYG